MGQSASSQREREEFLQRDSRRFSQLVQDRETRDTQQTHLRSSRREQADRSPSPLSRQISQRQDTQPTPPFATFSRQISAQSIPVRGSSAVNGDTSTRNEVFYEQEERPLVNMEDLGMRNAPITHITASPMPRRPSIMSRLGSRFLPRYSTVGPSNNSQESYGEGRTLRRRLSDRVPSRQTDSPDSRSSNRFSMLGPLSPGSSTSSRSRRRRELAPISRPFPLTVDGSLPPSGFIASPLRTQAGDPESPTPRISAAGFRSLSLRNSRLSRVRRSISSPLEGLFSSPHNQSAQDHEAPPAPRRPTRNVAADDADYLLPPLSVTDSSIDLNDSALESNIDPGLAPNREQRMQIFPSVSESPEHPLAGTDPSNVADAPRWTHRWTEQASAARREARRVPNLLRGRSSRLIRRDDEGPLPRILQLAAAAIAAQLSGTPNQAITNMEALGADGLDGSLNTLFQTLQNATTSAGDGSTAARTTPPMNFLRVFRFVNSTPNNGTASAGSRTPAEENSATNEDNDDGSDGRTVTLVVVGVRSVPSGNLGHGDTAAEEPNLDALLSLPMVPSNNVLRSGTGGLLRHADGRPRFPHRRRASMGGVNTFPANYDSQRHQRMHSTSRPVSGQATPVANSAAPLALSDSPPGPHPPPSSPADGLSAYPSGTTTPNRRPSSASALQYTPNPSHEIATQHLQDAGLLAPTDDQSTRAVQQRRRSDSEFARHRDLGAGAARRNGVVEPDDAPSQGSRSWLIYVVGTNLSEDHPAFATPSLFTDVRPFHQSVAFVSFFPSLTFHLLEPNVRRHAIAIIAIGSCETTSGQPRGCRIRAWSLPDTPSRGCPRCGSS